MRDRSKHPRRILPLLAVALVWACNDGPTAPTVPEEPAVQPRSGGWAYLSVVPDELDLVPGETFQLALKWRTSYGGEEPTCTVRWVSHNDEIATVSQNGLVEAKGRGRATIRAMSCDYDALARIEVR